MKTRRLQFQQPTEDMKQKSLKMFRCNLCEKEYSNIGGIVTHQKNAHGEYDPSTISKTINNKSKENLGRPMQYKQNKEEQSFKIQNFFEKVQSGYTDKSLQFFLCKDLKFVFNTIMEAGDPIVFKTKYNLFVKDFKDYEFDPWKKTETEVDFEELFGQPSKQVKTVSDEVQFEHSEFDFQDSLESNLFDSQSNQFTLEEFVSQPQEGRRDVRIREFFKKLLEYLREDQIPLFSNIFQQIHQNLDQSYTKTTENIKEYIKQNQNKYPVLMKLQAADLNQLINNIVYGTICYVKEQPNVYYNNYFGYK